MIQRRTWHCEFCDEDFKSGAWLGCAQQLGKKHEVPRKEYYSRHGNYVVCIIKPVKTIDAGGRPYETPGHQAMFANYRYSTGDPEQQEKLDNLLETGALITYDQLIEMLSTPEQKVARAKAETVEANKLLDRARQELGKERQELENLRRELADTQKERQQLEDQIEGQGDDKSGRSGSLAGRRTSPRRETANAGA